MIGNFLTDAWNSLTGKPQSWYTNVSNIQNQLSVLMAGVTAVGSDIWDTVWTAQGDSSNQVDEYDQVVANISAALTSIIVTTSNVPSDAAISAAQATVANYQGQLNYVESVAPEMSDVVAQDQAQVTSMLPSAMTSPSGVAQQVFADELAKRAAALGQGILDFSAMLPWILGGIAAIMVANSVGGKR
jgi:hypothetical protein